MTESNDIIQSFVKNVFEHNDVDFEALSVATKKMAESAVFGVINAYQNIDKENSSKAKDSTSQVDTSISDFDSILASTSKLIQSTTDNIDTIPDASRYF